MKPTNENSTAAQAVATGDLLSLLRFARNKIHVRPPGLEDRETTEWALNVSRVLPEFDHWDGQPKANRRAVDTSWDNAGDELRPQRK